MVELLKVVGFQEQVRYCVRVKFAAGGSDIDVCLNYKLLIAVV